MSSLIPGQKPAALKLDVAIDAATMAFLHVRLRIRDGEFAGALVAITEVMRNLSAAYVACRLRALQERRG